MTKDLDLSSQNDSLPTPDSNQNVAHASDVLKSPQPITTSEKKQRPEFYKKVEAIGNVLPSEHELTQLFQRVATKLGAGNEIEVFAIDSDLEDAFFNVEEKALALSVGTLHKLAKSGLVLKEDHIAALISSELEQPIPTKQQLNSDTRPWLETKTAYQSKEFKSDMDGMTHLAQAGYNPRALIEVYHTLMQTSDIEDSLRLPIIDRVRHLEQRLFDDEHPVPNVGKEMIVLDESAQQLINEKTHIYDETEKTLSLTADQLQEKALKATTIDEFLTFYKLERHARRIEYAKFVATNDKRASEIVRQAILLQSMTSFGFLGGDLSRFYIDGKIQPAEEQSSHLSFELNFKVDPQNEPGKANIVTSVSDALKKSEIATLAYRNNLGISKPNDDILEEVDGNLDSLTDELANKFSKRIAYLESKEISMNYRAFIQNLKNLAANPDLPIPLDVMLSAFPDLSAQLRAEGEISIDSNFENLGISNVIRHKNDPSLESNPAFANQLLEATAITVGALTFDSLPINTKELWRFKTLLEQQHHLNRSESTLLSNFIIKGETQPWFDYLHSYPREKLISLHQTISSIPTQESLRTSNEQLGKGFEASQQTVGGWGVISAYNEAKLILPQNPFFVPTNETRNATLETSLREMVAWELYQRGLPESAIESYDRDKHTRVVSTNKPTRYGKFEPDFNGAGVNLTNQEWDLVIGSIKDIEDKSDDQHFAHLLEKQREVSTITNYLDVLKNGGTPNEEATEALREVKIPFWPRDSNPVSYKESDLLLIFDHSPWNDQERAIKLGAFFMSDRKPVYGSLPSEQREKLATMMVRLYNDYPSENLQKWRQFTPAGKKELAKELFNLYLPTTIPWEAKNPTTLDTLQEQDLIKTFSLFSTHKIDLPLEIFTGTRIERLSNEGLESLREIFANSQMIAGDAFSPNEYLTLLLLCPDRSSKYFDLLAESSKSLREKHGSVEAINWIDNNLQKSTGRTSLIVSIAQRLTPEEKKAIYPLLLNDITSENLSNENLRSGVDKNSFHYQDFSQGSRGKDTNPGMLAGFKGKGRHAENFSDILTRRHAFHTMANVSRGNEDLFERNAGDQLIILGSPTQRFLSQELLSQESQLLDLRQPIKDRVALLTSIVPFKAAVRDSYIEFMFQDIIKTTKSSSERLAAAEQLFPLFSEKCQFKDNYARRILRDKFTTSPVLLENPKLALDQVLAYLPNASLARNYFLDQIENRADLTPEQLRHLISLRMTDEGQKPSDNSDDKTEASPDVFYFNMLRAQNRPERIKTLNWLLNISGEKPKAIVHTENDQMGSLDSLKAVFAELTPNERTVYLTRLFLGSDGILDTNEVPNKDKVRANEQKREFLELLATSFVEGDRKEAVIFRKVFINILTQASPARSSQILSSLINSSIEYQLKGQKMTTEQSVALTLSHLGVVGKKVAQSLAEMDWVPESYKKQLRQNQENAGQIPKRALLAYAESAGLLKDDAPFTILRFGKLLGSASNKQTERLFCRINDPKLAAELGVEVGQEVKIVGKFKRPSAQKSDNIEHDLKLLDSSLESLKTAGLEINLPNGFTEQIKSVIDKELKFENQREFAEDLRTDISTRSTYKGYRVTIPKTFFTNNDLVFQTEAEGSSLRSLADSMETRGLPASEISRQMSAIHAVCLRELLGELLVSGKINIDPHPGNIFVDLAKSEISFIDLDMNVEITPSDIHAVRNIAMGLVMGRSNFVARNLKDLGWELNAKQLRFVPGFFQANTKNLLSISANSQVPPPEKVAKLIVGISKLETYSKGVSIPEIIRIVRDLIPPNQPKLRNELSSEADKIG